jgi:ATP-dependent Lon protease
VRRVILPSASAGELREVAQDVRDDLDIVLVERMEQVLSAALDKPGAELRLSAAQDKPAAELRLAA